MNKKRKDRADTVPAAIPIQERHTTRTAFLLGGLLGIILFVALFGIQIIDPRNTDWIEYGAFSADFPLAQGYFLFFLHDDWNFPQIGWMDNIMTASGGTPIMYSEAVVPLAMLAKLCRAFLPEDFQYMGFYQLLCFFLQGGFACAIMKQYLKPMMLCLCLTPLFLLTPVLIWRLFNHIALVGQWLILFCIFVWIYREEYFFTTGRQLGIWCFLCASTVWLELYFLLPVGFAMVGFLMGEWLEKRNWRAVLLIFCSCVAAVLGSVWVLGGFVDFLLVAPPAGISTYTANLLTLFDPDSAPSGGAPWGRLLPDIPNADGNHEGACYLGISGLLLLAAAVVILLYRAALTDGWRTDLRKKLIRAIPLVFTITCVSIISFGSVIRLGTAVIAEIPWFHCGPFRSVGRSFWLCFYALFLFITVTVFRTISKKRIALLLALLLVCLQGYDVWPSIQEKQTLLRESEAIPQREYSLLQSDFWEDAAQEVSDLCELKTCWWGIDEDIPVLLYAAHNDLSVHFHLGARFDIPTGLEDIVQILRSIVEDRMEEDTMCLILERFCPTDFSLTGESVVELRVEGYRVYLPRAAWEKMDTEKYRDLLAGTSSEAANLRAQMQYTLEQSYSGPVTYFRVRGAEELAAISD